MKKYLYIICIIFGYILILGCVFSVFDLLSVNKNIEFDSNQHIIFNNSVFARSDGHDWYFNYYGNNFVDDSFSNIKYNVYSDGDFVGKYKYIIKNMNIFYVDDSDEFIDIDGDVLLLEESNNYSFVDFNLYSNGNDIIKNVVSNSDLLFDSVSSYSVYEFGANNFIYVISYLFNNEYSYYFGIISDGVYYPLKLIDYNSYYYVLNLELSYIIRYNDKYDYFVFSYDCDEALCYTFYQYDPSTNNYSDVRNINYDSIYYNDRKGMLPILNNYSIRYFALIIVSLVYFYYIYKFVKKYIFNINSFYD